MPKSTIKAKALEKILTHEPHKRNLYCGYLGELNSDSAALYVNLRCMKITNSSFSQLVSHGRRKRIALAGRWVARG